MFHSSHQKYLDKTPLIITKLLCYDSNILYEKRVKKVNSD